MSYQSVWGWGDVRISGTDGWTPSLLFEGAWSKLWYEPEYIENRSISGVIHRVRRGFRAKATCRLWNLDDGNGALFQGLLSLLTTQDTLRITPRYDSEGDSIVLEGMLLDSQVELEELAHFPVGQSITLQFTSKSTVESLPSLVSEPLVQVWVTGSGDIMTADGTEQLIFGG